MSKPQAHLQMQEGGVVQLGPCAVAQVVWEAVPADGLAAAWLQQTSRTGHGRAQEHTHTSPKSMCRGGSIASRENPPACNWADV